MTEAAADFSDTLTVDRVSVRLRRLQMRLWDKMSEIGRVATPQARAVHIQLHQDFDMIAAIAYALEEGRLEIREPTEDTLAARMATDVDLHFGVTPERPADGS